MLLLAGIAWRAADASGRRLPAGACRVDRTPAGPDRSRGLAPGGEGDAPAGWTEADSRSFDWNGDGKPDGLDRSPDGRSVTVGWLGGSLGGSLTVDHLTAPPTRDPTGDEEPARPAAVADLTGDGWPDLVIVGGGVVRVLVGPVVTDESSRTIRFDDIGTTVEGWEAPPVAVTGQPQVPYDDATVRPLWDLDRDGADDVAVISNDRRAVGPITRYLGRPCASLAAADRLSHRPGTPDPALIAGDGRATRDITIGSGTGTVIGTGTYIPPTTTPPPPKHGRPSYLTVDAPDPSILREGAHYFLFTTNAYNFETHYNVPVRRSSTLWAWDSPTEALPHVGPWSDADHTGKVWAPAVRAFGSTYVLYYSARVRSGLPGAGRQCIGRATSNVADGPYVDNATLPLVCQTFQGGSIDPHAAVDAGGVPRLTFKNDGNCCGLPASLWSVPLTSDGLGIAGAATSLYATDQAWEPPTVENPALVVDHGVNWLFYSGGDWQTAGYAMGYGWCWTGGGSCVKTTTAAPWLSTGSTDYAQGPGGGDLFTDPQGGWWVTYHGWINGVGYAHGGKRSLFVDKVDFGPNGPALNSDVPYESIIPKPGPVEGVTASPAGHNLLRVRWAPVVSDPPPSTYQFTVKDADGSDPFGFGCSYQSAATANEATIGYCVRDGHTYDVQVAAVNAGGIGPPSAPARVTLPDAGARFVGVTPARVLDTRTGDGVAGRSTGRLGGGQVLRLDLAGHAGLPAAGQYSGVVLNVTAVGASETSHLRVYPGDAGQPPYASSLNFDTGATIAGMVTVAAAPDGTVKIFNNSGQVHVVADVVGYYGAPGDEQGALHRAIDPSRALDTRLGQGLPGGAAARVGAKQSVTLDLAGHSGLPAAGNFSSVIMNVTAVAGSERSHIRVFPGDQADPPNASSLNFEGGQTIANLVTVRAAADGTVKLYNQSGDVDLVADVVGYYGPIGGSSGALFYAVAPGRVMDTRTFPPEFGGVHSGTPFSLGLYHQQLDQRESMSAAVLTVTVAGGTDASHLTIWPSGQPPPTASNLNFGPGQVIANQASVKVSASGQEPFFFTSVSVSNNAGTVQLIADLNGWFGAEQPG